MSYLDIKKEVSNRSKKTLIISVSAFILWLSGSLLLKYFCVSIYVIAGYGLFVCGVVWFLVRNLQSQLLCSNCKYDLEYIVQSLDQEAESGYCPKCGNKII